MKTKLLIILSALLGFGCASYSFTHVHGNTVGTYVYNGVPLNGNATMDVYSCIGSCPAINSVEVSNATNTGSQNNSSK